MTGAKGDLLSLGKVLVDVPVELQFADVTDGDEVLGPDFSGIENIKVKVVLLGLGDGLDTKLPLRIRPILNGLPEILAVEIRILASELQGLIPDERVDAQLWSKMKLNKVLLSLCVDESVGIDAKTLHHAKGTRDGSVGHGPEVHVCCLGVHVYKVPKVVVC